MKEEAHWDGIGQNYSKEIFDVFKSDRNGLLPKFLDRYTDATHTAIDFGCGTGKAFPLLSPRFAHVLAMDISSKLLSIARQRPFTNISLKRMDLSKSDLSVPMADFVFCCNVIMLPEIARNEVMLANIQRVLNPRGHALIVVPSLDSILFSAWRLIDWYRKEGVAADKVPDEELSYFKGKKRNLLQGIMHIEGVRTKHYSYSELTVLLKRAGLKTIAIEKLEYNWNTEFDSPPAWMGEPYPWDWLIECQKE
jgi:SAM-dependent methyltransferase